ncbi:hypothetical protein BSKO_12319 [Bryopsis sp. KO-2023]|nr:hypothetical protein BSKO_12319 [Bryopsis sp. KO-2023]
MFSSTALPARRCIFIPWLLWVIAILAVVTVPWAAGSDADLVDIVCPNALAVGDPSCKHGGTLRAINNTDYKNCAYCKCPSEWAGAECNLCKSPNSCPDKIMEDGVKIPAISCTNKLIQPTKVEMALGGKEMSCFCGGIEGDETTAFACKQQPGTNLKIKIMPPQNSTTKSFSMSVLQRAGMPSQDFHPPCYDGDGKKIYKNCPTKERYKYAYPQVWQGDFLDCSWTVGECIAPATGSDCIVYSCNYPQIECPPPYVNKCPEWDEISCGKPEGEDRPYWVHHCSQLVVPWSNFPITVACKPDQLGNGAFQCYMQQPALVMVASVGLQCYTGSCIYEAKPLPPDPKPPRKNPFVQWVLHHSQHIMVSIMALFVLVLVVVAGLLIHRDKKRSLSRAEVWAGQYQPVGDLGFPLLTESEATWAPGMAENISPIFFSFDQITYVVQGMKGEPKHILKSISGVAARDAEHHADRAGSILAIMGPSGAGKTSLLDVLSGQRTKGVSGNVWVNGNPIPAGNRKLRTTAGYVRQEDILPGTSTVFEYLLFNAVLRMPATISQQEKETRVFSIIKQLGLKKVGHNFIGDQFTRGLSGGEKRRVSIGCELLVGPGLMFLDEPTTGLDSTNAAKVVDILADMAAAGVTVIITIHQPRPDLFRTIDRVMLLSGLGQVVYAGPSSDAESYFSSLGFSSRQKTVHVIDYMLDVVIKSRDAEVDTLVENFSASDIAMAELEYANTALENPLPLPSKKHTSTFFQQVRCLSTRLLRNASRHPVLIAVNFVANLVVALLLGLLFYDTGDQTEGIQSRLGVLFFIILFLSMMSLSSLPVWREERLLFTHERDAGVYQTTSYFVSVLLFDLVPLRMLPPVLFSVLSFWMIGLHEKCAACLLWFTLIVVLTNVVATLMSMTIGAASPSTAAANTLGSMVVMVFLLFGGFLLNKDEVPWYCSWVAKISYFNFGYEALAINEFMGTSNFHFSVPMKEQDFPPLRVTGEMILCEFGFHKDMFGWDIAILFGIGLFCTIATYVLLLASGYDFPFTFSSLKEKFSSGSPPQPNGSLLPSQRPGGQDGSSRSRGRNNQTPSSPGSEELRPLVSSNGSLGDLPNPDDSFRAAPIVNSVSGPNSSAVGHRLDQAWGVRFPSTEITVADIAPERPSLTLSWTNICCKVWSTLGTRETTILQNISGVAGPSPFGDASIPRSMLFAIMGPSGAGKTTLMDILAGRKRDSGVQADIRLNGSPVAAGTLRKLSGYVLQEDVLPGTSTVYECVLFHAKLRLPSTITDGELHSHVLSICDRLGLTKVIHSLIGDSFVRGLSGGEKRRVSIGCELLVGPGLMFLDEPTTGLDSTNAAKVVDILADMAAAGVTVIITIHQPRASVFNLMDRILVLSGNGQVVYTGSGDMAANHLAWLGHERKDDSINVTDFMLDLIIKSSAFEVERVVSLYRSSDAAKEDERWREVVSADSQNGEFTAMRKYEASHFQQLKVLSSRMGRDLYRHPSLVFLNYIASLFVSLGLGAVYFQLGEDTAGIQNRLGALFFILMYLSLMSLGSMPLWQEGRLLFVRERASGLYGTTSYFFSILFLDILPMRILPPVLFGIVSYFMIGLRSGVLHVFFFILVVILVNVAASTLSMAIGAAFPSASVANMVGSLLILSDTLLGGFFLGRKQMEADDASGIVNFLSKFSYIRYAFEALVINEFHGAKDFSLTVGYRCVPVDKTSPSLPIQGDEILGTFGFPADKKSLLWDFLALAGFVAVHLSIMYVLIKVKDRPGEAPAHQRLGRRLRSLLPCLGA